MLAKYAVLIPVIQRTEREEFFYTARTSGTWWQWAFHQYIFSPGSMFRLTQWDVVAELHLAYRKHRLPPVCRFWNDRAIPEFPRLPDPPPGYAHDDEKDVFLTFKELFQLAHQRLRGLDVVFQIMNLDPKHVQKRTELEALLKTEYGDLMLANGLYGLLRDHISYHFLQSIVNVCCRRASFDGVRDLVPTSEILANYQEREQLLWRMRCSRMKSVIYPSLHLWLTLALMVEHGTASPPLEDASEWSVVEITAPNTLEEWIVPRRIKRSWFPVGREISDLKTIASSGVVAPDVIQFASQQYDDNPKWLEKCNDKYDWLVFYSLHASLWFHGNPQKDCVALASDGYCLATPRTVFQWLKHSTILANATKRIRFAPWNTLIQCTLRDLQHTPHPSGRIPRGLSTRHVNNWWVLPSIVFEMLVRTEWPDEPLMSPPIKAASRFLPSAPSLLRAPFTLPISWIEALITPKWREPVQPKGDAHWASRPFPTVNPHDIWTSVLEQSNCTRPTDIEDLVLRTAPRCMLRWMDDKNPRLDNQQRYLFFKQMLAYRMSPMREFERRRPALKVAYQDDKSKINSYRNEWKWQSNHIDTKRSREDKNYGYSCQFLCSKTDNFGKPLGLCPFNGNHQECNTDLATRHSKGVHDFDTRMHKIFGVKSSSEPSPLKKTVVSYMLQYDLSSE